MSVVFLLARFVSRRGANSPMAARSVAPSFSRTAKADGVCALREAKGVKGGRRWRI
jgi:hypothetical protein